MNIENRIVRVITEQHIDDAYEESKVGKALLWAVVLSAVLWFGGAVVVWLISGARIP